MKMRKGKADYKAPEIGMLVGVTVLDSTFHARLLVTEPHCLVEERMHHPNAEGRPRLVALSSDMTKLMFFPAPDFSYQATLRYYPPMIEV